MSVVCTPARRVVPILGNPQQRKQQQQQQHPQWSFERFRGGGGAAAASSAASQGVLPTPTATASIRIEPLADATRNAWQQVQPVLLDPDQGIVARMQRLAHKLAISNTNHSSSNHASGAFETIQTSLARCLRLSLVALFLAEILSLTGVFPPEESWSKHIHSVCKKKLNKFHHRFQRWWDCYGIETWPEKYQWALGAAFGMILSPSLPQLSRMVLQSGAIAYALAEANDYIKHISPTWQAILEEEQDFKSSSSSSSSSSLADSLLEDPWQALHVGLQYVDAVLEQWRIMVRQVVLHPDELLSQLSQGDVPLLEIDGLSEDLQKGLLSGALLGAALQV